MSYAAAILLTVLTVAPVADAPIATQNAAQTTDGELLDLFASTLPPREQLVEIVLGGCETAYRTKLSTNASDIELEKAIPGIHDQMIAAVSAHCNAQIETFLAEYHQLMRDYWGKSFTPAERARLAPLLRQISEDFEGKHINYQPGDMARDAVRKSTAGQTLERFNAAAAVFGRTPGGQALLDRLKARQAESAPVYGGLNGPLHRLIRAAQSAGYKAANDYARSKGFTDPYPDAS